MKEVNCPKHGAQGIGLVCDHIAHAVDSPSPKVGFFWGDDTDTARPDAWCKDCEDRLIALDGRASDQWFEDAGFKILCAACWDEVQTLCR